MDYTTLNNIRIYGPCKKGWATLLSHLGKTKADDEPVSFLTILESNGLDDAIWCLQTVPDLQRESQKFAIWCAKQVRRQMADRFSALLNVAERYVNGEASNGEMAAAWDAMSASIGCGNSAERAAFWAMQLDESWIAARYAVQSANNESKALHAQEKKFFEMFCQPDVSYHPPKKSQGESVDR